MDKVKLLSVTILNSRLLTSGIILFLFVSLFGVVGGWFIDHEMADVGAGYPSQPFIRQQTADHQFWYCLDPRVWPVAGKYDERGMAEGSRFRPV